MVCEKKEPTNVCNFLRFLTDKMLCMCFCLNSRLANRIDIFSFFEQLKMRNICVLFILQGLFLLVLGENKATESIFPSNTNLPIKIGESEKG